MSEVLDDMYEWAIKGMQSVAKIEALEKRIAELEASAPIIREKALREAAEAARLAIVSGEKTTCGPESSPVTCAGYLAGFNDGHTRTREAAATAILSLIPQPQEKADGV